MILLKLKAILWGGHAYNKEHNLRNFKESPNSGVVNEEIDAVNFQNYYHQGKGEALRTTYKGRSIAKDLTPLSIYFNIKK